ncbi:BLUF domain-containing protein [Janthinobacterium sp. UMAB-56]|uniref:BLUF domain-containing protein n=1 Tax=Janthinobacterium sp. UMAB-56 TaxID=1365361 RepID=UPI00214C3D40|nr:BLUF domain-containing protein [Janthinobacterium sp. UMAB-56]
MQPNTLPTAGGSSMIRLLYLSSAVPLISDKQVQDILLSSRRNNSANCITGILIHGGGLFMQVLEGPEQEVLRKYVKILDDPRHSGAQILYISPATNRIFEKWSMGGIESDPLQFQYISKLRARRLEAIDVNTFTDTMREFAKRLRDAK